MSAPDKPTKEPLCQQPVKNRPSTDRPKDIAALKAVAQAAVNVELFTIPLYMTSLYSIYGMHQITGKNNDFYQGRLWPGLTTNVLKPEEKGKKNENDPFDTYGNKVAFNGIFSVFIAEMLHLQLASNVCNAIGVKPIFTGKPMQSDNYGWMCYGADKTQIPHILDFKDCKNFGADTSAETQDVQFTTRIAEEKKENGESRQNNANSVNLKGEEEKRKPMNINYGDIKVSLGPIDENQINLFLAIEETETAARQIIKDPGKYFPTVPFNDWEKQKTAADLPLFGSIGHMYECLFFYLTIRYTDGTLLINHMFNEDSVQQDIFNQPVNAYHKPEYPGMNTSVSSKHPIVALYAIADMIGGITDQGEGHGVAETLLQILDEALTAEEKKIYDDYKKEQEEQRKRLLTSVAKNYQPDKDNLEHDYPTYNDKGEKLPQSRDAYARSSFGSVDHFDTFLMVKELWDTKQITTWPMWHQAENEWEADKLKTGNFVADQYPIPSAKDVAGALNRLKKIDGEKNFHMFSQVVVGAIKGVTSVLNDYFSNQSASFPFPSMSGSGDRMSLCWAVFGKAPDLSMGVEEKVDGLLYHACQGLGLDPNLPLNASSCAPVAVFHTCKGSNTCAAEGGCGFVQSVKGGGSCGNSAVKPANPLNNKQQMVEATTGPQKNPHQMNMPNPFIKPVAPAYYGAPSDNRCQSFGGCAVPISASQIFPVPDPKHPDRGGKMELFNFVGTRFQPEPINTMEYQAGELVYDVAWSAYIAVLQERKQEIPVKPKPSDIRVAFPPST